MKSNGKSQIMNDRSQILFRRILVVSAYLLLVLSGIRGMFFHQPQAIDLILSISMSVVIVKYCIVDSKLRGRPLLRSYHWLIFFTWPLSLPIYLLSSRGLAKGFVAILLALGGVLISYAVAFGIILIILLLLGKAL